VSPRKPTWCFRPPADRYDELLDKAKAIVLAKDTSLNALVAGYVTEGIDRDWAVMQPKARIVGPVPPRSDASPDVEASLRALSADEASKTAEGLRAKLHRPDSSPNLQDKS
jgi:hypothetical protein